MEKLASIIQQTCIDERARVLIPSFANQRTQTILTLLWQLYGEDPTFNIPVLIDSPMAVRICKTYLDQIEDPDEKYMFSKAITWRNVKFIEDPLESKAWRESKSPAVIVSSSGMLVPKTRALQWAADLLPRVKDRICFVGYSSEHSIASTIKEGRARSVNVGGRRVRNNCQITQLYSFSSHMQRDSLLEYYASVDCQKIILVHGDPEGKIEFAKELGQRISKYNHTAKVVCSFKYYSVTL